MKYLFLLISCLALASCSEDDCKICTEVTTSGKGLSGFPKELTFEACGEELEIDGFETWNYDTYTEDTLFQKTTCK